MKRQEPTDGVSAVAQQILEQKQIPCATYRLQLNSGFTLHDAGALVPYLEQLGVSDCYLSPIFRARPGSSHGYDVCDHGQLNPELGGEEGFELLCARLRPRGMGIILDVVPNHIGIGADNAWWMDVLENGPSSTYAAYFDIDWHPVKPDLENKVLLPIMDDQYGNVLESGKLRLCYEEGAFCIYYYDHRLPVAPRTYSKILSHTFSMLAGTLPEDDPRLQELQSILTALGYLPPRTETDPEKIAERFREKEIIKRRLATLSSENAEVGDAVDRTLQMLNGTPGDPGSFDLLSDLIDAQAYRVAFWRVAADEVNYRRFFDINDLAAIRVEVPEVFEATHQLIFQLLEDQSVTGLRIDHPDGLWDPPRYFRQLQQRYLLQQLRARFGSDGLDPKLQAFVAQWFPDESSGDGAQPRPLYIVAEKILCEGEALRQDWAIDGTTGYDFLSALNGIFVNDASCRAFDRIYAQFTGSQADFRNLVHSAKKMILLVSLASEIQVLSHHLDRISEMSPRYRDFTLNSLTFALREVIATLPVYRTYVTGPGDVPERDQKYIQAAVAEARRRNPRTARAIFDFIQDTLLLRNADAFPAQDRQRLTEFVMKFQQLTGPATAKGVEDTVFYTYNRLVSLNEVGGHPERFGLPVPSFHQRNAERSHRWPHSLLATSTHDCKRGEDVRARINVLSEIPEEWRSAIGRWARWNARHKTMVDDWPAPDRNEEYLLYQTLVGAWPEPCAPAGPLGAEELADFRQRILAYMQKATREAKVHTSWINPHEEYDAAVAGFAARILDDRASSRFLDDFRIFQARVAFFGRLNGLAQTVLKLTCPGVPDLYQGTELWDLNLVDPDNRGPVDYRLRRRLLAGLRRRCAQSTRKAGQDHRLPVLARELLDSGHDGRIKLYLVFKTLDFRRRHRELFSQGSYLPLEARGEKRDHLCAFVRELPRRAVVVVTPRLMVGLTGGVAQPPVGEAVWRDTRLELPPDHAGLGYKNVFTGEIFQVERNGAAPSLPLAAIFGRFPFALLKPE
ncbi:MAG: malto-oligosyltrehalose synthase [Acidobacteria bacterium]|nr:malto-oligosyltrehalose synthase [Acidobacteriota bacterium]